MPFSSIVSCSHSTAKNIFKLTNDMISINGEIMMNKVQEYIDDPLIYEYVDFYNVKDDLRIISDEFMNNFPNVKSIDLKAISFIKQLDTLNTGNYVTQLHNKLTSSGIQQVIIGNSITIIPEKAFRGRLIKNLVLGNSIKVIGKQAFFGISGVSTLQLPHSLETIGYGAFSMAGLESISFGNSIKTIEDWAFAANNISTVNLPNSIETIGEKAFAGSNINLVSLGNSVKNIGKEAFWDNNISLISIPKTVETIGDFAFQFNKIQEIPDISFVANQGSSIFANQMEKP
jgi:hypothetical protein